METIDEHSAADHDALSCPQCQAFTGQAQAIGGLAEGLERALDTGVFERLGAEMARRQEEAVLRQVMGAEALEG